MTQGSHGTRRLILRALLLPFLVAAAIGCSDSPTPTPGPDRAGKLRVHYHRNDGIYTDWGIYSWEGPVTPQSSGWPVPNIVFDHTDANNWGTYVDVAMDPAATQFSFIVLNPANGGTKDCQQDEHYTLPDLSAGADIWILSGDCTIHTSEPTPVYVALASARAMWLDPTTLVWPGVITGSSYQMYFAPNAGMTGDSTGIHGDNGSPVTLTATTLSDGLKAKYPQWATAPAFTVDLTVAQAKAALKGQVAVVSADATGKALDGTSVQTFAVLDALYADLAKDAQLGVTFDNAGVPTFRLWAPTAQSVKLNYFADHAAAAAGTATQYDMVEDTDTGVWSYTGDASWTNTAYYTYAVQVYSRLASNTVVTNTVTDPYSTSLDGNSRHSMVLDLGTGGKPTGFDTHPLIPSAQAPTDAVVYELHVRDFSANDGTLADASERGKFTAFADTNASGYKHLQKLAQAGLTHVHLLPAFDFATTDELACNANPTIPASTGVDQAAQAAAVAAQESDCYNWGYDPLHYGVPEGSYSTDPDDGVARVSEFRSMVMALHSLGLRVFMDVVYNHTNAAGQDAHSVLDKIVPGYYNRMDNSGAVTNSSCCSDTATENAMMAKLMTDTLIRWADQYKVDGFRFDLMGMQPKQAMVDALAAVDAVAEADGRGYSYFYGEGWNNDGANARFVAANQIQTAGTHIGTFNDRMRDGVRGGGPFDSGAGVVDNKGFISGQCTDGSCAAADLTIAKNRMNWVEVSLAGNLKAFPLNGSQTGEQVDYNGAIAGYAENPEENIAYVSAHDNETIWDIEQYKHAAAVTPAERARAQVVGLSTAVLAQGVAFIHAGDELLRSKSGDGNSYNSGDYFNRIYWDGSSNNWAVGAPPQNTGNNARNLTQLTTAVANTNTFVTQDIINASADAFTDFLAIRKSSRLFRLETADDVLKCVRFPDQGLGQTPGVIVMEIGDGTTAACQDENYASAVIVFNGSETDQSVDLSWYHGRAMALHTAQAGGHDTVVQGATFDGTVFSVPARTTAVFVEAKTNAFTGSYGAIGVPGEMDGWDPAANSMKLVAPHQWQVTIPLSTNDDGSAKSYQFKFAADGAWDNNWPGSNASVTVAETGNYVFMFNDQTQAYAVLPPVWFPGAVSGLQAHSQSETMIKLTWSSVRGATGYDLWRSESGDAGTFTKVASSIGALEYVDTGLTEGTKYYYQVVALNALFTAAASNTASATPSAGGGPTSPYPAMYMNGNWNGWAAPGGQQMTLVANNTWEATIPDLSGTVQWKFDTDDHWGTTSGATAWTASDFASTAMTGTAAVSPTGEMRNISVALPAAGAYKFTFHDDTLAYEVVAAP